MREVEIQCAHISDKLAGSFLAPRSPLPPIRISYTHTSPSQMSAATTTTKLSVGPHPTRLQAIIDAHMKKVEEKSGESLIHGPPVFAIAYGTCDRADTALATRTKSQPTGARPSIRFVANDDSWSETLYCGAGPDHMCSCWSQSDSNEEKDMLEVPGHRVMTTYTCKTCNGTMRVSFTGPTRQ